MPDFSFESDHKQQPKKLSGTFPRYRPAPETQEQADRGSPQEQEKLFEVASAQLPLQRNEVRNALENVDELNAVSIRTAAIIEHGFRAQLTDLQTDCLVAAAILAGGSNWPQIIPAFEPETKKNIFMLAKMNGNEPLVWESDDIANGCRLMLANMLAQLEYIQHLSETGYSVTKDSADFKKIIHNITSVAHADCFAIKTTADVALLGSAVGAFDALAQRVDLPLTLKMTAAHDVSVVQRKTRPSFNPKP